MCGALKGGYITKKNVQKKAFTTQKECEQKVGEYFDIYLRESGEVADIESLADYLGITRDEMIAMMNDKRFGKTLRLARNKIAKIKRGDIVVFDVSWQSDPIVKRVIGVAGDTIEIKNDGAVYVNGVALEEDYIQGKTYTADGMTPLKLTVPEGHIFCLGDNREHSHDSRYSDIGTVSLDLVRGKCILIVDRDGGLKTP
jgi:signal peptidase I